MLSRLLFTEDSILRPLSSIKKGFIIEGDDISPDIFNSQAEESEDTTTPNIINCFNINAGRIMACSERSTVYRATFNNGTDAVLKLALGDVQIDLLLKQASIYLNELKPFQGSTIPILYGVIGGSIPINKQREEKFAYLLLEYCGKPVSPGAFVTTPKSDLHDILQMLQMFHAKDYEPQDMEEEHILRGTDGKWRMVGFHQVIHHTCEFLGDWHFGTPVPHPDEPGCPALWDLGVRFRIWAPWIDRVQVGGRPFLADLVPSQDIIDMLTEPDMLLPLNRRHLINWLQEIRQYIDKSKLNMDSDKEAILAYAETRKPKLEGLGDETIN